MRQPARDRCHGPLRVIVDDRIDRRAAARIMNDNRHHARHGDEHLAGEVARRAGAGRRHSKLAGIGLHQADQFLDIVGRQRRIDRKQGRADDEASDRGEVPQRIERHFLDVRQERQSPGAAVNQRVTVGRRFDGFLQSRLTEDVLDLDGLAEQRGHALRDDTGLDICGRSQNLGGNESDRLGRVVLRGRCK